MNLTRRIQWVGSPWFTSMVVTCLALGGSLAGCESPTSDGLGVRAEPVGEEPLGDSDGGADAEPAPVPTPQRQIVGSTCAGETQVALLKLAPVATLVDDEWWVQPAELQNCTAVPIFIERVTANRWVTVAQQAGPLPPLSRAYGFGREFVDDDGDGIVGLAPGGRLPIRLLCFDAAIRANKTCTMEDAHVWVWGLSSGPSTDPVGGGHNDGGLPDGPPAAEGDPQNPFVNWPEVLGLNLSFTVDLP